MEGGRLELSEEESPDERPAVPRLREGQDLGQPPHVVFEGGGPDVDDGAEPHARHALSVNSSRYAARVPEPVQSRVF